MKEQLPIQTFESSSTAIGGLSNKSHSIIHNRAFGCPRMSISVQITSADFPT